MKFFAKVISLASVAALAASCATPPKTPPAAPAASPSPTPAAKAKADAPGERLEMKCEMKGDVRTVTVVPKDGGCELHYLKLGKSEVVASSSKGTDHCDEVQAKMRKNLEGSGFKCN